MGAGFRDLQTLTGVWFSKPSTTINGGFRSVLELSGVWITGANAGAAPAPTVSEWIVKARRRARR